MLIGWFVVGQSLTRVCVKRFVWSSPEDVAGRRLIWRSKNEGKKEAKPESGESEVEHGGICIWERVNANTTCTYQLGIRSMDIKFRDSVYYTVADHSFYAMKEDDYLSEQRYGQPLYYEAHMIDDDRVYIIDHSINESYVINCAETEPEKSGRFSQKAFCKRAGLPNGGTFRKKRHLCPL